MTIGDVARRAGVGLGTVSRVLNDRPNVRPATRARVLTAITELDFVPSTSARRLMLRRTQTIGVVLPFLTRPAMVEQLRGIERALARASLDMIVFNVETVERRDAILRELPRPERIDGLILFFAPHDEEFANIHRSGLPVVLDGAYHRSLPRVVFDDVGGGAIAARYLLDLGHTRIGFVGDVPRTPFGFSSSRLRLRGVERALREEGLAIPRDLIIVGAHSRERARELADALLDLPRRPTAIIAASDTQALGILEAAQQRGIDVPGELSVIGYDDIEAADYAGLTTIHEPLVEAGERAAERLIGLISGVDEGPLRQVLGVSLVVRRTTAPPDR